MLLDMLTEEITCEFDPVMIIAARLQAGLMATLHDKFGLQVTLLNPTLPGYGSPCPTLELIGMSSIVYNLKGIGLCWASQAI